MVLNKCPACRTGSPRTDRARDRLAGATATKPNPVGLHVVPPFGGSDRTTLRRFTNRDL